MKIFGRDPALWLGLAGAIISVLGAFALHLTSDQQGVLNAVAALIVGVIVAVVTGDGQVAAILALFKGALALVISFGFHLSAGNQALLYTLAAAIVAVVVRDRVVAPVPPTPPVVAGR